MRRTRAELRAEVLKAGRGAGLPLGVAEDLAQATPWMTEGAVAELAELLESAEGRGLLCAMVSDLDCQRAVEGEIGAALSEARVGWGQTAGALNLPEALWSRLTVLAVRTYVPETAQSRASGAGAGDIDND